MQLLVLWILLQWSCLHIVLIFGTYSIVYKTRYISQGSVSSNLEQTKFPFFLPLFFVKSTHSLQKNSDNVKISSLVTLLRYTLQLNTTRVTITAIADKDMCFTQMIFALSKKTTEQQIEIIPWKVRTSDFYSRVAMHPKKTDEWAQRTSEFFDASQRVK